MYSEAAVQGKIIATLFSKYVSSTSCFNVLISTYLTIFVLSTNLTSCIVFVGFGTHLAIGVLVVAIYIFITRLLFTRWMQLLSN